VERKEDGEKSIEKSGGKSVGGRVTFYKNKKLKK